MSNPISEAMQWGAFGELLVQIRLLEFGVQAAPPLEDSGNDLIAVRGRVFKSVQVKTVAEARMPSGRIYDLVAFVDLAEVEGRLALDASRIFIVLEGQRWRDRRELTQDLVDEIWRT